MNLDQIILKLQSKLKMDEQDIRDVINNLVELQEELADAVNDVVHQDDETTEEVQKLRNLIDESI